MLNKLMLCYVMYMCCICVVCFRIALPIVHMGRQDMLELLKGTVSSRRTFIKPQHSFVGRSITFAYRIVASHFRREDDSKKHILWLLK